MEMDKKYLVIIRIHDPSVLEAFGGEQAFVEQAKKWRLEIERVLTLGGHTIAMINLPNGIDIEINRIDE